MTNTHKVTKHVFDFSKDNQPEITVKPGDTVELEAIDCFSCQLTSEEQTLTEVDFSKVNPATGPVYVEGAEPGDLLVVDILDIQVENQAVSVSLPGVGPLHDQVEARTRVMQIEDNALTFNDLSFPIDPMIGVIGVAPKEGSVPTGHPGWHGGNLDNNEIKKGAKLYFPVHHEGALFQCGDLHAVMGDGEIIGSGAEVSGVVTVKLDVIKNIKKERPILETETRWFTIATAHNYDDALKYASEDMQTLLVDAYGWDKTDAGIYMSLQGGIEICQSCKPSELELVVRFGVPKTERPLIK